MSKPNLSGCLTDKQLLILNERFPQLPFELGCVLDEAFFKILELALEKDTMDTEVLCYCDDSGMRYFKHITYDHETTPPTITIVNTLEDGSSYTPIGTEKKAKVEIQETTYEVVAGKDVVTGDENTVQLLAPPADVTGAIVQIDTSCCVRVCWDGTDPTATTGYQLGDGATICLGVSPNSDGDIAEVANFKIIAEPGCTYTATATYYK